MRRVFGPARACESARPSPRSCLVHHSVSDRHDNRHCIGLPTLTAIKKYIEAEQYLRIHLKGAFTRANGYAPEEKDIKQIYTERFKVVICGLAVCKDIPAIPDGSELKQLQFLAKTVECPKAVWQ